MAPSAISTNIEETLQNVSLKAKNGVTSDGLLKKPLISNGSLDQYESFDLTPVIGREFPQANLVDWMNSPNADKLLADLALTSMFSNAMSSRTPTAYIPTPSLPTWRRLLPRPGQPDQ